MEKKTARVISFVTQKGGQGKSTLSNALVYALKEEGYKVLLIDFDSQASQTITFNLDPKTFWDPAHPSNIVKMFRREPVEAISIEKNVDLIPSHYDLWSSAEAASTAKDMMLKRFTESVSSKYDYIVVDAKGGASTLMTNAVLAADTIVVPVVTSFLDEAATTSFFDTIEGILEAYSATDKKFVVIPNNYNKSTSNDKETLAVLNTVLPALLRGRAFFSNFCVTQPFPRKTIVASAFAYSSFLQPYIKTAPKAVGNELLLVLDDIVNKIKKG